MPRIPGVRTALHASSFVARPADSTFERCCRQPFSNRGRAANRRRFTLGQATKTYLAAVKRVAAIGAAASWWRSCSVLTPSDDRGAAINPIRDAPPDRQDSVISTQPQSLERDSARKLPTPPRRIQKLPPSASVAQPWSSKRFFFRSLTHLSMFRRSLFACPGLQPKANPIGQFPWKRLSISAV